MRQFILAIIGAGGLFLLAGAMRNHGWYLADQMCARGAILCDNPGTVLVTLRCCYSLRPSRPSRKRERMIALHCKSLDKFIGGGGLCSRTGR
jgi:hypothetical protein